MSAKNKKKASTGTRYTPAQKQEVVDFVKKYNAENGRGGQTAAHQKFKITQLTIGAWLKKAGGLKKTPKVKLAKPLKVAKGAKKSGRGVRYSDEQKQEVIDFVNAHNAERGRGGQNQAAKKFGLSVLTVSAWLKSAGVKSAKGAKSVKAKAGKAVKTAAVPSGLTSKIASLIEAGDQLRKAESEAARLRAKYDALRAAIQSLI